MKLRTAICSVLATGLVASFFASCSTQAQLKARAKVTEAGAQKIALAKVPGGTIQESELEKEKGKLVWSFDIATAGTQDITEVLVDALTGEIVAMEKEAPDRREKGRTKE